MKIGELVDLGSVDEVNLKVAGIHSTEELLAEASSKRKRKKLAKATGIDEGFITLLVVQADLIRIKGIGSSYAALLAESGIKSLTDLEDRDPQELLAEITRQNEEVSYVKALPSLKVLDDWIDQAKELPKLITY